MSKSALSGRPCLSNASPSPLGLNIDRCIATNIDRQIDRQIDTFYLGCNECGKEGQARSQDFLWGGAPQAKVDQTIKMHLG